MSQKLKGVSDIRRFFHRNETPVYFISATNFNLLGADEWVKGLRFINYIDCFDGQHPNVFVPGEMPHDVFESIEDINNYLLGHKEVVDYIRARGPGKALFLMFDEETEALAKELGLDVCFPSAKLRTHLDNKVVTTRIANEAGVPSVPNALGKVGSYADLLQIADGAKLGHDLVVQTPFGDSGHTTFFIASEADWQKHEGEIVNEAEVKVMKRIRCRGSAVEACVTRNGTIVAPIMTELVGFPELTPYKGGWCGNEIFATAFTPAVRQQASDYTFAIGERLRQEGYKGYFELDFLIDLDSDQLYLGEMNPRVTGASSITNHSVFALSDAPLFLFHLLEFFDIDYKLNVEKLNKRWTQPDNIDDWSQLVIKHTDDTVKLIQDAPSSGIWRMNDAGAVQFARYDTHRRAVESENEAFFLRISGAGDYQYEGADLGILVTRGRLMTDDFELTDRARHWIDGIRSQFTAVDPAGMATDKPLPEVGSFKIL